MKFLTVKNWDSFQHYKKRNPPWIKLHRAILDDYGFCSLPDQAKAHLILIWAYASQNNGSIPHDVPFLERKLSVSNLDLEPMIARGFLLPMSASGGQAHG